jgi:tetratricopeptide (TPR) repeat protein/TolB-like protein
VSATLARLAAALADHYAIERELGHGGMATVYLAHDLRHDRDVALKVLRPELAAVLGRERFLAEIRLTARLDHPHILTLHDSGESDGFLWYALPYIRGESLRHKLERERQLGLAEALAIAQDIASALDYAHHRGIIHRDVKPENILLHEGEAMLADFGIALAVREAGGERLTETGLSVGTPQYMSPEQATAERQLDARSDVYSLGCVLYEMLAGEPPFTGPTGQAVIAKLMTERPTRLRTIRDTVPQSVDDAVGRALGKVPADRYATAGEFAGALDAPVPGPPVRHRRHSPMVAGAVLLALGATVAITLLPRDPKPAADSGTAVSKRVVVLPFENRTGDPANDDLGSTMAEWIVAAIWRDAREWAEPVPMAEVRKETERRTVSDEQVARELNARFTVSGTYFRRADSLEFRTEIREGPTGKVVQLLDPVVVTRTATSGLSGLADRTAVAVAWRGGFLSGIRPPSNIQALQAELKANAAFTQGDHETTIEYAQQAAALDTLWFAPVERLLASYGNTGRLAEFDSLSRAWATRRFGLPPFEQALLDWYIGWWSDGELAYRASQVVVQHDSADGRYIGAITALITNRPRTALLIASGRSRDTSEWSKQWAPWADAESFPFHMLGQHDSELVAMKRWRAILPRQATIMEHEAVALAALDSGERASLLADSALLMPPDEFWYPNVGLIPAVVALELRAHGHPELAPALLDKALAWFAARTGDSAATLRARFEEAQVLAWAGRYQDAERHLQRLVRDAPDSAAYLGMLGVVESQVGDHILASQTDHRLATLKTRFLFNLNTLWRANMAAADGRCDRAVDLLRQALLHGQVYGPELHRMPYYDPIRSCPAFQELLKPRD